MIISIKNDMEKTIALDHQEACIDIISVCRDVQHQGIASALIDHLFSHTAYTSYTISVTNINEYAFQYYKKKGFQEVKREKVTFAKQKGFSEYIFLNFTKCMDK